MPGVDIIEIVFIKMSKRTQLIMALAKKNRQSYESINIYQKCDENSVSHVLQSSDQGISRDTSEISQQGKLTYNLFYRCAFNYNSIKNSWCKHKLFR